MKDSFVKKLEHLVERVMDDVMGEEAPGIKRAKKLVKVSCQSNIPELSDTWYEHQAKIFLNDYDCNKTEHWEEIAVDTFCGALAMSYGNVIDRERLLKAIKDKMKELEDDKLDLKKTGIAVSLKEIAAKLRKEALLEEELEKTLQSSHRKLVENNLRQSNQALSLSEWQENTMSKVKPGVFSLMEVRYSQDCNTFSRWEFLYQRELRLRQK